MNEQQIRNLWIRSQQNVPEEFRVPYEEFRAYYMGQNMPNNGGTTEEGWLVPQNRGTWNPYDMNNYVTEYPFFAHNSTNPYDFGKVEISPHLQTPIPTDTTMPQSPAPPARGVAEVQDGFNPFTMWANNPYIGMGIPTQDKFRIAGMGFGYNPSHIDDPTARSRANRRSNVLGGVALASGLLDATKGFLQGRGIQNRTSQAYTNYIERVQRMQRGNPQYLENGGIMDLPFEKLATDDYVAGLPKSMDWIANAEVEGGEYIASDKVRKVEGDKHKDGGEKVFLNGGDMVLSDKRKVGEDLSKTLEQDFKIKVKKNDTYSTALDKYSDYIGYSKVASELEGLFKKLDKSKNLTNIATKQTNVQFLEEQIAKKQQEKDLLQQRRDGLFGYLFAEQEAAKEPTDELEVFEDGGIFASKEFREIAKRNGMSVKEAISYVSKTPQYQNGVKKELPMSSDSPKFYNPEQYPFVSQRTNVGAGFGNVTKQNIETILTEMQRLHPQEFDAFLAGDKHLDSENVKKYQKAINDKYDAQIAIVKERVKDPAKQKEYIAKIEAEKFTKGVRGFDGKLGNFTSTRPAFDIEAMVGGSGVVAPSTEAGTVGADGEKATEQSDIDDLDVKDYTKRPSWLAVPQMLNLPPDPMQPHASVRARYDTVTPAAISPDAQLNEIARAGNLIARQTGNMPAGLRSATLANANAQTIHEASKAVAAVEAFNAQNKQQVEQINSQNRYIEENQRINEIPRYEALQLTALDKTLNDFHNYFNTQQRNAMNRYNYMNKAAMIDSIFPNIRYDPFGRPYLDPNTVQPFYVPANTSTGTNAAQTTTPQSDVTLTTNR